MKNETQELPQKELHVVAFKVARHMPRREVSKLMKCVRAVVAEGTASDVHACIAKAQYQ